MNGIGLLSIVPLASRVAGPLVVPKRYEPRVAQVIIGSPFDEFKLTHEHGPEPPAVSHLRRGQALTPSPRPRLRQIGERTLRRLQSAKPLMQLLAHCRSEPAPGPRGIDQQRPGGHKLLKPDGRSNPHNR